MGRRRKTFDCGHQGYGRYCHRCRQKEEARAREAERRQAWRERLKDDPIELGHLPRHVVEKTRAVLEGLRHGRDYTDYRGKRMHYDRTVISIPIGYSYRLICRDDPERGLVPVEALSHEAYNTRYVKGRP